MVSSPARLCGTLPYLQPPQDPSLRPLSPSCFPVQAAAKGRGADPLAARIGAVPPHEEQRAGQESLGESGKGGSRKGRGSEREAGQMAGHTGKAEEKGEMVYTPQNSIKKEIEILGETVEQIRYN